MTAAHITAVVLSAGASTRMGDFKPLLPLGKGTVIEQLVSTIKRAGICDIQIVLGHRAQDVIPVLKEEGVCWVINKDYTSEMMSSVKVGTGCLRPDSEALFILPVDIPLIRSQTLHSLSDTFRKERQSIVYPTFEGKRGHPPLIPRQYAGELMQWAGKGGLKGFLEQYDRMSLDVPVFDEGILMDMDTPEQYQKVATRYETWLIPSQAECAAIMASRFSDGHPVIKHGRVVSQIAQVIGNRLIHAGCKMDVDLLSACGYLHDIGKGEKYHAKFGADLLKRMGYPNVSEVIATHMDLDFAKEGKITEKEVIYLADKMTDGESILKLNKRLELKLDQLADNPKGKMAAEKRIKTAMQIERTIEKIIGEKIGPLVEGPLVSS